MVGGLPWRVCFTPFPPEMAVPSFPAQSDRTIDPPRGGPLGPGLGEPLGGSPPAQLPGPSTRTMDSILGPFTKHYGHTSPHTQTAH